MTLSEGWVGTSIADVADTKLGKMLDAAKNVGDQVAYLRNINVRWGSFDLSDLLEMRVTAEERAALSVRDGDLFMCEGGEPGRCAVWRNGARDLVFQKAVHRIRPVDGVEADYLQRHIAHLAELDGLSQFFTGTTIKHLPQTALQRISIPLPPAAEQRRIVAKLDALTARLARARAELDRVLALAKRLRKQSLSDALEGTLTRSVKDEWSLKDQEELASRRKSYLRDRRGSRLRSNLDETVRVLEDDRSGWLDCKLADVITLRVGYAFKSADFSKTEGLPLLRGANVAPGRIDWTDQVKLRPGVISPAATYILDAGDIVIAMDRPVISTGLKIARIEEADAGSLLVQRVANPRPTRWIDADYLMIVLRSDLFMRQIDSHATGTDLPHISGNDILTTPCPLPPMTIQKRIVAQVTTAFAHADRLEAEAARARALIDRLESAILAKAFRGELVPQDPNDEPASALLDRIRAERAVVPKPKRGRAAKASA